MLKSRTIFDILKSVFDKKDQEYNAILTCSVVLWGTEVGGGAGLIIEIGPY